MTQAEVDNQLLTLKEQLFKIREESTAGRLERPNRIRQIKRDIARCLTILKEKESGEQQQSK
jgi:large subunit ribosomal protein L29